MMDLYVWITYLLICHEDQQNSGKYTIHTMDPSWRCFLGLNFLGEFRFESHRSPSALQQRLPARWLQPLHRSLQCDWRPEGGKCSGLDFQRRGWSEANVTSDLFGEKTVKKKHIHTQSPRNLLESCDIRKKIYICYGFGKLCLRSLQPLLGIWWVSRSLGFLNTIYLVMSQPSYKTHVKDFTSPKQRDSCRNHYRSLMLNEYPLWVPVFDIKASSRMNWVALLFFSSFSSPSSLHNSSDTIRMRNFTSNLFSTKGVYALVFQIKYCQEWQWHKWKRKSSHWKRLHNWKLGNIKPQWSHMNPNAKSNEVRQSKKKLQPRSNREFLLSSDSNFAEASKYLPNQLLTSHLTGWHDFLCIRNTLYNANVQT